MFDKVFFQNLTHWSVAVNKEYRELSGDLLYKGAPRVEVILLDRTRLVAHFLPAEQPKVEEGILCLIVYGEAASDPSRIVFLPPESITRVEVYEPTAQEKSPRTFGFAKPGSPMS